MKQDLWRRAEEIFHAALERSPELRSAYLDQACGDDPELRRQVEILVSTDEHAGSFLETPLLADVTRTPGRRGSLVGRQCGPYRILSLLGAGGMGEVYRAHDCKLGRDVAIKTLPSEFMRDPERLARFRREARSLASLNHPNIAAIYGLEESAEIDYLVLELVEGDTLHGPLPLLKALDRACQAAEALEAAHEHGIIHRDLKPANVKVTPQGNVKVLDFGLAKPVRTSEGDLSQTAAGGTTLAWHIVGTPGYMSPEQARGAGVDQRTDIWAFGCLLFELLTGKRAFEGETASDTIAAVLDREPDWRALPPETPASIRELLRQCLQKDAGRRPNHIREARAILEEVQRSRNSWWLSAIVRQAGFAIPVIAVLLLLGLLGARLYNPSSGWPWWGSRGLQWDDGHATAPITSVAVLPFANLSGDTENAYFGDGLAEDISNALSKLPGLRVIPPAPGFLGKDVGFSQMGMKLKVAGILEGSVRKSGTRIRVTAQLIQTADRTQLWSERYDREMTDVFAIQDEISHAIMENLRVRLAGHAPLVKRYTENVEAYNLYLRGRHSILRLTPQSLVNGKQYLEQAIALDGNYALAYTGLAEYYWASAFWGFMPGNEAVPRAKAAALAALKQDDTLAEAHAQLAVTKGMGDFDWAGAEQEFQRALQLNPASPIVRYYYGFHCLRPMGRLAEELSEARRVVDLDPLSARYNANLGYVYGATGQHDLAVAQFRRAIELDPSMYLPDFMLAMAYVHMRRFEEATSAAKRACELSGRSPRTVGLLAWVYGQAGRRTEAQALLQELSSQSRTTYVPPSAMAAGYAALQETDAALEWLDRGIEQRDLMMISNVKWTPVYLFLHGRPRYQALLRKMNLAE